MNYRKLLKDHVWSFSALHTYETCPYAFYCHYIEHRDGEDNYYAENGRAVHRVIEGLLKGNYGVDEAPAAYMEEYDLITSTVRQSTMDKTFNACLDYFCEAEPLSKRLEVLMVEQRLDFKIGKNRFMGYADAVLHDKATDEIILLDHKSSNHFLKRDGTPLKNSLDNFNAYKRQAYLYCKGLLDEFHLHVTTIYLHHFKDKGRLTIIPFNDSDYLNTQKWAVDLIEKIKSDKEFKSIDSYMMCRNLCDFRYNCEYANDDDYDGLI